MCCSECPAVEDSVSAQPVRERISTVSLISQLPFPRAHFHPGCRQRQLPSTTTFPESCISKFCLQRAINNQHCTYLGMAYWSYTGLYNFTKINLSVIKFKAKKRLMWRTSRAFSKKPTAPSKDYMSLSCTGLYASPVLMFAQNLRQLSTLQTLWGDTRGVQSYQSQMWYMQLLGRKLPSVNLSL